MIKRLALSVGVLATLGAATAFLIGSACVGTPGLHRGDLVPNLAGPAVGSGAVGVLRVMSLNLAHGRSNGAHQLLLSSQVIENNLGHIGEVLERERPDVVAVQEADAPSFWSGAFDHLETLSHRARLPVAIHGAHVQAPGLRYGTGLLARIDVEEPMALTFAPSPPTPSKGLTVGSVRLDGVLVDVVSVHLDFASAQARQGQIDEMARLLAPRDRPLIVMGDFNAGWDDPGSSVRSAAEALRLQAWSPGAAPGDAASCTFPGTSSRLDWILVSPELELTDYRVLDDEMSDHRAVAAGVRLR